MKQILEKCGEYNITIHQIFVDFTQAYDNILRNKLYNILSDFKIPNKLIRLIQVTMTGMMAQVKVKAELSETFEVRQGLKQGDGLAPTLFNLALEYVIRKLGVDVNSTIHTKTVQILGYADDIGILARRWQMGEEVVHTLDNVAEEIGLNINTNKTKVMKLLTKSDMRPQQRNLWIKDEQIERVGQFLYLGTCITEDNNELTEIQKRISIANKTYFSLINVIQRNPE